MTVNPRIVSSANSCLDRTVLNTIQKWKYAWEKPYLDNTDNFIFRNTFKDIEQIVERLGKGHGTRFEFECYDVGHLYTLAHFLDRGLVGDLRGTLVVASPLYKQHFSLASGRCLEQEEVAVATYPVRVNDGWVEVALTTAE